MTGIIVIDHGRKDQIATRWVNRAGIGESPRLIAVEWRDKGPEDRRRRPVQVKAKPKVKRGIVQGSLL